MNTNRFLIPALVAAAAHVALLCIPNPSSGVTVEPPTTVLVVPDRPLPNDDEPLREPLPAQSRSERSGGGGGKVVPMVEEPPRPVDDRGFTMPVPDIPRPIPRDLSTQIPNPPSAFEGPGEFTGPPSNGPATFLAGMLDREPRTRAQMRPDYPFNLRNEGVEGTVHVEFTVGTDGRVRDARATHSTDRRFEEPAVRAVGNWRFEPGRIDGKIVAFRMAVSVEFRLDAE